MMRSSSGTSADSLMREALGAFDTCLGTLAQIEERARALGQETETAHQMMQRYLHDVGLISQSTPHDVQMPARPSSGPVSVDHEAIYRDEVALQQAAVRLRTLQGKLDYLTNMLRTGRAHVLGSDPGAAEAAPWATAVRAARIEAQEDERQRLAREVHDGPAQVLANAILNLEYCEMVATRAPGELAPELQRLRQVMREGLIEVRRFMFDLRPTMLASMGLNATLARSIEDFRQAHQIAVTATLPHQELAIDDNAQIVIFRVVQESLQNIHKHAEATAVWIDLARQADGTIRLHVADNGKGFDHQRLLPTLPSGMGMIGMRERAALLGGTLAVESALGRGTSVTLLLPAHAAQPIGTGTPTGRVAMSLEAGA
jgi:two-component system, NarL family, sensor histidine kinase DegS